MTNMVPTIIKEGTREVTTSRNIAGRSSRAIVMEASAYLAGDGDGAGILLGQLDQQAAGRAWTPSSSLMVYWNCFMAHSLLVG